MNIATRGSKVFLISCVLLCLSLQGLSAEVYYPWKDIYIGALEGRAWGGLVFAPHRESVFAFRIRVKRGNDIADGIDLFYLISEVGPHSPDGQYARVKIDLSLPFRKASETPVLIKPPSKSDTLVFEWSRQDEKTVVGKIEAPEYIELHLIHYFPWDLKGRYQLLSDGHMTGESSSSKKYHYLMWTDRMGNLISETQDSEATLSFNMEKNKKFYFVAGVDEDARILRNHIYRYKNIRTIDSILRVEGNRYRERRVKVQGLYEGVASAITNNLFWMMLYQPGSHRLYSPPSRRLIFPRSDDSPDHWTIFEWGSFFNALQASVESFKYAEDILKAVIETQYPNGNIPNWRGRFSGTADRSQPPVGSYVVLKFFQKSGDKDFLEFVYPFLKKWHAFWKTEKGNGQARRDGNGDGLLEWGTDEEFMPQSILPWEKDDSGWTRARRESGQYDLPNWDEAPFDENTGTLAMNCLDLNSLYTLDAWCLAQIANVLGKRDESRNYLTEYEEMKNLVNSKLWDETEGFYFDRHWDGRFSTKKAASNFYPLLARIPDQKRAMRMLKHLLNPKEYWGDYILPSISRDNPAFTEQQSWRGTIRPTINYLVYQGLKAYGFDVVASEYAMKSSSLFLRSWENFQLCPENYDSRTGEAGGQRYQSWGPLIALIALEEYLDFTPWDGFRFGMISPEKKGKLSRVSIQGRHYDLEVSPSEIKLKEEGKEIIKTNGPAVFRHFLYSENDVSFEIKTLDERDIRIKFLAKGKYQLWIDDQPKKPFRGNSLKIKVPEGEHTVRILLLEKKE